MDRVLKAQIDSIRKIQNFFVNSTDKAGAAAQTASHFEARLTLLDEYWHKFEDRHDDLVANEDELQGDSYFKDDLFTQTETEYISAKARLRDRLAQTKPALPINAAASTSTSTVQTISATAAIATLPTLALPTFSGKQGEWESFKQRFCSLIKDKPNIPRVEKLQHLLNAVQGTAAHRLKGLDVTDSNFDVAWEKLVRRYDNIRIRLFNALESLIQLPAVRKHNVQDLNNVIDKSEEAVRALRDLNCPVDQYNAWLVHCVLRKLDLRSREAWEASQGQVEDFSTYDSLIAYLERRIQTLEQARLTTESSDTQRRQDTKTASRSGNRVSANNAQTLDSSAPRSDPECDLCDGDHWLHRCHQFNAESPSERLKFCKKARLCLNCLKKGHGVEKFPSSKRCFKCQAAHHTKLHLGSGGQGKSMAARDAQSSQAGNKQEISGDTTDSIASHSASVGSAVILATARVVIANQFGKSMTLRALIDPAAERCFITKRTVQFLNLNTEKSSLSVIGVGATESSKCTSIAHGFLKSSKDRDFVMSFSALVLSELTRCLPKQKISVGNWPHLDGLELADPDYTDAGKVDCILGADIYSALILNGIVKGPVGSPMAQHSVFGWLLTGAISTSNPQNNNAPVRAYHLSTEPSLAQLLTNFWEIEEVPRKHLLTPDEERCENHFAQTYTRDENGRFLVRLPFAKQPNFVGSREIAAACLARSERRLLRDHHLAERYDNFMSEYQSLNHMEPVPLQQQGRPSFYLPHHAVVRPENPAKIRVVFNASQKARNGLSLNDLLLPGPKLQADISIVLTSWRFFRVVFTTDVVKMFRKIKVHKDDVDWQRILWRDKEAQRPQDFRCVTVTYGTAAAPFLALRVMKQLAMDGADEYPEAASILQRTLYVDDCFGGADTMDEALKRRDQLVALLASAGMTLGKWAANLPQILQDLNSTPAAEVAVEVVEAVSTLGLKWLPGEDAFMFRVLDKQRTSEVTKRTILSEIARLFDPLGWIAPVIIVAKICMQDLWLDQKLAAASSSGWDDAVPPALRDRWLRFRTELTDTQNLRIPRWLGFAESSEWHLHGFADASTRAYAACVYAVIPGGTSTLLMSKTKVAPTKVQSLPRLELCAATLLARLISHVQDSTLQAPAAIHTWSDSRVVLDWLSNHPSKWPTFIANRTSEIMTRLPTTNWRHVRSADNAADCATRGLSPAELATHSLWWHGPSWLPEPESRWPASKPSVSKTDDELQAFLAAGEETSQQDSQFSCNCLSSLQKFSNFNKIMRILAYCSRWRLRMISKQSTRISLSQEWALARVFLFRAIQREHFGDDVSRILKGDPLPKRSPLIRLNPFIDEKGLIRVGGRLHFSPIPYNEKHPVLLPGGCILVKRLFENVHELTLHGGVQLMLSHLYRSLWITRGHAVATGVYNRCVRCTRFRARCLSQQMGPLPVERTTPSRAFATTGLDYAGPIPVLFSRGRGAKSTKGYVAIFICLVTRATHIEIVSDLTTNAFLAVYARFSARRGVCDKVYSDNATTFKKADKDLQSLFAKSSPFMDTVVPALAFRGTEWSFIPPRAAHFGGLWEAAVRSFKHHFRRVIGDFTLTFEELSTLAAQIEACLNSRPLCPLSNDAVDLAALTPAHFLVRSSLLITPGPYHEEEQPTSFRDRWRLLSQLRDSFWKRWRKEVLHHMQQRNKWLNKRPNLREGDIVLLTDELSPPTQWHLGRVTQTHPGADGLVRVVTLKNATS